MENEQVTEDASDLTIEFNDDVLDITDYCIQWLIEQNRNDKCSIKVQKQGYRISFYGWVDSYRTKGQLFELVKKLDGFCWIQDYLYIREQI